MDDHPNATILRRLSDQMNAGMDAASIEAIMNEGLADDVEWHEIGRAEPTIGKAAMKERVAYVTSKAGVLGMARAMALDLAQHRVRVNAISPGRSR